MTAINESNQPAIDKTAMFSQFYSNPEWKKEYEAWEAEKKTQTKKDIERKVKGLEDKVKEEKEKQEQSKNRQKEFEAEIEKVKGQITEKTYGVFVNPSNPSEVYKTGEYTIWMKDLAKKEGIDIHDKTAMAKWVKMKKSQTH